MQRPCPTAQLTEDTVVLEELIKPLDGALRDGQKGQNVSKVSKA